MAHQIVDQPRVAADLARSLTVRHPRGLHDGRVVAHVIDDPDEAVIEDRQRLVENFLQRRNGGAAGLKALGAGLIDFGAAFGRQIHATFLQDSRRTL